MPITCQLCQKSFEKLISSTHLRFCHQISSDEYRSKFGTDSLASPEYRQSRSASLSGEHNPMFGRKHSDKSKAHMGEKKKGQVPHNKGITVTDEKLLEKIRNSVAKREQRYRETNAHPRKNAVLSEYTRQQISQSVKAYAKSNPDSGKERAAKSLATLRARGFDFGSRMRGKTLSPTTRAKIKLSSQVSGEAKRAHTREIHQQRASSAEVNIIGYNQSIVSLQCLKCTNHFELTSQCLTASKFRSDLCPYCRLSSTKSRQELEVLDLVRSITPSIVMSGNRSQIFPLELDMFIPDQLLAIEYCGLYWHSELQGKGRDYHLHKMLACQKKNIRLITVFEDEWVNKRPIVTSRLTAILGQTQKQIGARRCTVSPISTKVARQFCRENHLQGEGSCSIALGLFHNNALVSAMTFSKPTLAKGQRDSKAGFWELNRFCSLMNHRVQGAAGKLFSAFITNQQPEEVFTYADMRWSDGNLYRTIGFEFEQTSPPNYWYTLNGQCERIHRFSLRKNSNDDLSLTEWQNRQLQGYNRIWDCGNSKWVWRNKKAEQ